MASRCLLVQNIAGSVSRSNIAKVGLSDALNMYAETQNPNEHSTQLLMRSASGEKLFVTSALDGACRGMYRVSRGIDGNPALYCVFGQKLYLVDYDADIHEIATLDTVGSEVRMVETGGYQSAHPHLVLVDGTNCYAVDCTVPVATQRTDFRTIALPVRPTDKLTNIKPTHVVYCYNYLAINDEGSDAYYLSYQYPFEVTTADDEIDYDIFRLASTENIGFITYSEWCPDNTTCLVCTGSKMYTLGPRSWQAWSFNDDVAFPFSSPDNAAGGIGIKAPNSAAVLGSSVLFLGASDIGENGVFMLQDTKITRISTGDLEREISNVVNPENAYGQIWQEHRHAFYALTFEDSKVTYVYDITEGVWHRRGSYDNTNNLTFWRYNHATFAYNRTMVAGENYLCCMDENCYEEHDGRRILKMRRGAVLTSNDQPFYIDSAELITNNGQHSFNNDTSEDFNPRVSIRYSWDGSTWSDYEDYYLGLIGNYEWSTTVWQLGLGRYFTLEISTTEKIPFTIQNLKIGWQQCSNFI